MPSTHRAGCPDHRTNVVRAAHIVKDGVELVSTPIIARDAGWLAKEWRHGDKGRHSTLGAINQIRLFINLGKSKAAVPVAALQYYK